MSAASHRPFAAVSLLQLQLQLLLALGTTTDDDDCEHWLVVPIGVLSFFVAGGKISNTARWVVLHGLGRTVLDRTPIEAINPRKPTRRINVNRRN